MKKYDIEHMKDFLKAHLSPQRYHHSQQVGKLASQLAKIHGWKDRHAYIAGLLHDCCKEWSPKRLKNYVKKNRIRIPDLSFILRHSPNLLHGYVSAHFAKSRGWTHNPVILKAMATHTLGSLHMTVADKIIYVSDFSSFDRTHKKAPGIRKLAKKNIHQAFFESFQWKMRYQLKKNKPIHPLPHKLWNHLVSR